MNALDKALAEAPVVAVVRHDSVEAAERIALAAIRGGIRLIEVTFTVPDADQLIERLRALDTGAVIGAGTVLTLEQLESAARAGAEFAVSPLIDEEIIARAVELGIPFLPGAFTPTEVARAMRAGAFAVKIFPASSLGTSFLSALRDVMPHVRLMPTGGIAADGVRAWLDAGAAAVGLAGALASAWREGQDAAVEKTARVAVTTAERSGS